jgi:hypothetical protein
MATRPFFATLAIIVLAFWSFAGLLGGTVMLLARPGSPLPLSIGLPFAWLALGFTSGFAARAALRLRPNVSALIYAVGASGICVAVAMAVTVSQALPPSEVWPGCVAGGVLILLFTVVAARGFRRLAGIAA